MYGKRIVSLHYNLQISVFVTCSNRSIHTVWNWATHWSVSLKPSTFNFQTATTRMDIEVTIFFHCTTSSILFYYLSNWTTEKYLCSVLVNLHTLSKLLQPWTALWQLQSSIIRISCFYKTVWVVYIHKGQIGQFPNKQIHTKVTTFSIFWMHHVIIISKIHETFSLQNPCCVSYRHHNLPITIQPSE